MVFAQALAAGLGKALVGALLIIILILLALSALSLIYGILEIVRGNRKIGIGVVCGLFLAFILSRLTKSFIFLAIYFLAVSILAAGRILQLTGRI